MVSCHLHLGAIDGCRGLEICLTGNFCAIPGNSGSKTLQAVRQQMACGSFWDCAPAQTFLVPQMSLQAPVLPE